MAMSLTVVVEYDPSYTDAELDEFERELNEAGVSAQLQQVSPRAGLGELAVGVLVFVGTAGAELLVQEQLRLLWLAVLSMARRRRNRQRIDQSGPADVAAASVMFEFNRHRVVVTGDHLDDVTALDLLAATSRLTGADGQRASTWIWDPALGDLRPAQSDQAS
jgi:hypothetical protein